MNLIDKNALVAEITKRKNRNVFNKGAFEEDIDILSFLDTLEVKEVDLKKELELWMKSNADYTGHFNILEFAKYFFELGLKTQKGE